MHAKTSTSETSSTPETPSRRASSINSEPRDPSFETQVSDAQSSEDITPTAEDSALVEDVQPRDLQPSVFDSFGTVPRWMFAQPVDEPQGPDVSTSPVSSDGIFHLVLEPGRMRYCTFEGRLQIHLPEGATWYAPAEDAVEVYFYDSSEGSWSWNLDPNEISGADAPKIWARNNFWSARLRWRDSAGATQETALTFVGPDKASDAGKPDGYSLCDLAFSSTGCPSCAGLAPATRLT